MAQITFVQSLEMKRSRQEEIFGKENVIGVGVGHKITQAKDTGQPCVKVYVTQKLPMQEVPQASRLETAYEGIPTDIEVMEPPFAFSLTQRVRPSLGGYSVGHYKITAGTIATCVRDKYYGSAGRKFYLLSNNHVLANENNASIGDPILQPGPYDGGTDPADRIARLSKYVPIALSSTANNKVDAAIAEVDFALASREIYWLGYPSGWRKRSNVKLNTKVQKTGRTTDYTVGYISDLAWTGLIGYGGGRVARFVDQMVISPGGFSAGGDSGSLITDINEVAVGLLFAGSSTHTIANYIEDVQNALFVIISENEVA